MPSSSFNVCSVIKATFPISPFTPAIIPRWHPQHNCSLKPLRERGKDSCRDSYNIIQRALVFIAKQLSDLCVMSLRVPKWRPNFKSLVLRTILIKSFSSHIPGPCQAGLMLDFVSGMQDGKGRAGRGTESVSLRWETPHLLKLFVFQTFSHIIRLAH